ncbi:MAG: GNAT family N-acetyltransferase [Akkermansia sp.]
MSVSNYKIHRLTKLNDPLFVEANDIYTRSFPLHEQRSIQDLPDALAHPDFRYEIVLTDTRQMAAILCYWETHTFVYIEHFAVNSQMRGLGIGQFLLDDLKHKVSVPVILEIDPPIDDISKRRLEFYRRSHFITNEQFDYIHPPYTSDGVPFPLLVLSYPTELDEPTYRQFETYHHHTIINPAL